MSLNITVLINIPYPENKLENETYNQYKGEFLNPLNQ